MQHHGAPTRLLDCTYSIYVAAYFALENADDDCAVWAVNARWALGESVVAFEHANKSAEAHVLQAPTTEKHEVASRKLFFEAPFARVAVPLSPFRQNERLRTQRATFLVPGDVSTSFMENLGGLAAHNSANHVVKIVIPIGFRAEALEHLYSMNISRRSLFPGLDGFAQSLGVYHPSFKPDPWERQ